MSTAIQYPKRLIEVDLPIKRISAHSRREKSIRHGHISTLHIWWARRPLAACRAVICASIWPDPADPLCPEAFRTSALFQMRLWATKNLGLLGSESFGRFVTYQKNPRILEDSTVLRSALLDFIADFSDWQNSSSPEFLLTSRALTQSAHESLGGSKGTKPLLIDPFAGGGSIPLEALRVGADAFASDLNPIPILLNKVVLEYIPKYGQRLADEVRKWGDWIKNQADRELSVLYPRDDDGARPIAYLWARTIQCEGPGCGVVVPLVRSLTLAKKPNRTIALQIIPCASDKRIDFKIITKQGATWKNQDDLNETIENPKFEGTVKRGSATCPCCGHTTPVARVREQLSLKRGGANGAQLLCVVSTRLNEVGRFYRKASDADFIAIQLVKEKVAANRNVNGKSISIIPDEQISLNELRRISVPIYGISTWGDMFSDRQAYALSVFARLVASLKTQEGVDPELRQAVATCLALNVSKLADLANSLCAWEPVAECPRHLFGRQAIGIVWDFSEGVPIGESSGSWSILNDRMANILREIGSDWSGTTPVFASATHHPLPDDSANLLVTDPPYYDAIPYAHLADFFYVWLRRSLAEFHPDLFANSCIEKQDEIVVDRPHERSHSEKDIAFYERELTKAFAESRRVVRPDGIGTIVFASKTTASWEAILKAVVDAGWIITGSWPIDTEMETRISAQGQARLASSVHLVCRPRENSEGSVREDETGDWRDVLSELPKRIHEWMPRLAEEGVVGADAIFSCLGPALEIFSRYSTVEKASGEKVVLGEYLEQVWAAVAKEALAMVFQGADASGFEEDARLTAMWLWTMTTGDIEDQLPDESPNGLDDEEDSPVKRTGTSGFVMEYDAARKISQGLGAHLEELSSLVEVAGDTARLLPVSERAAILFGKESIQLAARGGQRRIKQQALPGFEDVLEELTGLSLAGGTTAKIGETVLDRVHQSMLLFGAGRSEALRTFLVDEGIGRDLRFWRLAQALSALYPRETQEKRWVDGVLTRKKGLGF